MTRQPLNGLITQMVFLQLLSRSFKNVGNGNSIFGLVVVIGDSGCGRKGNVLKLNFFVFGNDSIPVSLFIPSTALRQGDGLLA